MPKKPCPIDTRRRRLGAALLAGLGLTAATAVHAVKPPPPPVQEGYTKVRMDLRLEVDGKPVGSPAGLLTMLGVQAQIGFGAKVDGQPGPDAWLISLTPTARGENGIMVAIRAERGAGRELVAEPAILVTDGGSGRVEIATPDGQHRIALDIQGRFVRTAHDSLAAEAEFRRALAAEAARKP